MRASTVIDEVIDALLRDPRMPRLGRHEYYELLHSLRLRLEEHEDAERRTRADLQATIDYLSR